MSERMTCMSMEQLLDWTLTEHENGSVYGVHYPFTAEADKCQSFFGMKLETPIGPAAGPNSQLAQNIIASYYAGSRFFELKTVQKMDGEELSACVGRPCIWAEDECYNCEWSTELTVVHAMEEYIKSWIILHIIAKEYGLGEQDGFQYNISVGYDLEGIKGAKVDNFINCMMEAKDTEIWNKAIAAAKGFLPRLKHVTEADIDAIPSDIVKSATVSTLHGCPPSEIESIASYLITEKGLNTLVKCNPTLLGYEFARAEMDKMGYDYVVFGDFHFKDDLQWEDAVPMLTRLMALAESKGLEFGVKITNTCPVDVTNNELPSEEMYMSGRSLFALSINLAAKLSRQFEGKLRIAYSGGIDAFNIDRVVAAGIWPVTVATTLLKTGGYQRCKQLAEICNKGAWKEWKGVDVEALNAIAENVIYDKHHRKSAKEVPSRKSNKEVPLIDCFVAPCKDSGCPIHQDIPAYVALVGDGKYAEALRVILDKNPLPFLTGTICAHRCMTKCTRTFYDEAVDIRGAKLVAAKQAYDEVAKEYVETPKNGKKVAIIGGGPTGISAAHFLLKAGFDVDIMDKNENFGGIPRNVIPSFRISAEAIEKDIELVRQMGGKLYGGKQIDSVDALLAEGYAAVIVAIGAGLEGALKLEAGQAVNAHKFLAEFKATDCKVDLGKNVVVVGGGNTAMDTARAAKRNAGVEKVSLVYRRTKRYMPADEDELVLAMEDGVEFRDLLAPVKHENGKLVCEIMKLSAERDASGRRKVEPTGEFTEVDADTVIAAVGEKVDTAFYTANGIDVTERGKAIVNAATCESSKKNVYVIGDALSGPATAVEGIRDAGIAAAAIAGKELFGDLPSTPDGEATISKKGILADRKDAAEEASRCLKCDYICENCVDVCPNRANIEIKVPGMEMPQIIHVDWMCNECGNCLVFCPYASRPYKDKFTLFANADDMKDSTNDGFYVVEGTKVVFRLGGQENTCDTADENSPVYAPIRKLMAAVINDYPYLVKYENVYSN